ncbi:MAG: hypothetical protein ACFCD0_15195, partial [Gemmataceae bacterium]
MAGIFDPPKHLHPSNLYRVLRRRFDQVPEHRSSCPKSTHSLKDTLMSGFALFALKDPSLLAFDQRRHDPSRHLQAVFGIENVPCDTQMRAILDPIEPKHLRGAFTDIFSLLQRPKILTQYRSIENTYFIPLNGVESFSSATIHCSNCCRRTSRNGQTTYYHQALCAS